MGGEEDKAQKAISSAAWHDLVRKTQNKCKAFEKAFLNFEAVPAAVVSVLTLCQHLSFSAAAAVEAERVGCYWDSNDRIFPHRSGGGIADNTPVTCAQRCVQDNAGTYKASGFLSAKTLGAFPTNLLRITGQGPTKGIILPQLFVLSKRRDASYNMDKKVKKNLFQRNTQYLCLCFTTKLFQTIFTPWSKRDMVSKS